MSKLDVNTTISDFFKTIFGEGNESMISFIKSEWLVSFKVKTEAFLKQQLKDEITNQLSKALTKTGNREQIIKDYFATTPLNYHFTLIVDLWNNSCNETKKHLYYYGGLHADMYESESIYYCIYCGKKSTSCARESLDGPIANIAIYKPEEKMQEAQRLFKELLSNNLPKEDIEKFVGIIVDMVF